MPRRKSAKIPANTREAKKADWNLTRHNNHAGVSAFKKRLRVQYGRRLGNREMKKMAETWNPLAHVDKRPEPALVRSRSKVERHPGLKYTGHTVTDTMRLALEAALDGD